MKLRLVKFLTSHENEIEKKEEGEGALPSRALPPPSQAAASAIARSVLALLFPSSFHPLLPQPRPARNLPFQLVGRHVPSSSCSSYPSSSCSASPFLLHKITEATERAAVTQRSAQPAGPASRLRAPSSPHPCLFTKSGGRGSSPVLMASSLWRVEPQENKDRK